MPAIGVPNVRGPGHVPGFRASPNPPQNFLITELWLDPTTNGWGTVDNGSLLPTGWVLGPGSTASAYSSGNGFGTITPAASSTERIWANVSNTLPSQYVAQGTVKLTVPGAGNTQAYIGWFIQGVNDYFRGQILATNTNTITMQIQRVTTAGGTVNIGNTGATINSGAYNTGDLYNWKVIVNGPSFIFKTWAATVNEPPDVAGNSVSGKWAVDVANDSTFVGGDFGFVGFSAQTAQSVSFGNLQVWPLSIAVVYADSGTVPILIDPSASVESTDFGDTGTTPVVITPASADVAVYADDGTVSLTLTPSAVETHELTDSATVGMVITPSSVDTAQYTDASTPVVAITPSATEIRAYVEAATVGLAITPSSADVAAFVDAATPVVGVVPSTVEGRESADSATIGLTITPGVNPATTQIFYDHGSRVVASGLGISDSGQPWITGPIGGSLISQWSVDGTDIQMLQQTATGTRAAQVTIPNGDGIARGRLKFDCDSTTPPSVAQQWFLFLRCNGLGNAARNAYRLQLQCAVAGTFQYGYTRVDANVIGQTYKSVTTVPGGGAGSWTSADTWDFELQIVGTMHYLTIWKTSSTKPSAPTLVVDTSGDSIIYLQDAYIQIGQATNSAQIEDHTITLVDITYDAIGDVLSATEAVTVPLTITPSGSDLHTTTDAGTVGLVITPSASEVYTPVSGTAYTDAATVGVAITPSAVENIQAVDSNTVRVTMTVTGVTSIVLQDTGHYTTSSGWGTPSDAGPAWTRVSAIATVFSSTTLVGHRIIPTASQTNDIYNALTRSIKNGNVVCEFEVGAVTATREVRFMLRANTSAISSDVGYFIDFIITTSGVKWQLGYRNGGGTAFLGTQQTLATTDYRNTIGFRFGVVEDTLMAKVWADTGNTLDSVLSLEPSAWQLQLVDSTLTSPGVFRIQDFGETGQEIDFRNIQVQETADFLDITPVRLSITPSVISDVMEYADSQIVPFSLTPLAVEVRESADVATVGLVITPSSVESAQYVDSNTAIVKIDPTTSVEVGIIHTDSANVPIAISVVGADVAVFADTQTVSVGVTPSATEGAQFADAASVSMTVTPSSTDAAQYVESVTTRVTLTPSATEVYGRTLIDTGTVSVALTPSASESAQVFDAAAVPVAITPSGTEALIPASVDSATARITFTPSSTNTQQFVEAATVPIKIDASASTEAPERAWLDSGTVSISIDSSASFEAINKAEVSEVDLFITPSLLSEFQGDGDIVPVRMTAALIESFVFEDTNVVLLSITGDYVEAVGTSTDTIVAFQITPDTQEFLQAVDAATILVSITPGVIFESRVVADYLLVGVLSSKWTGILRDNHLAIAMKETRYIVQSFDNRWHYHWKGRGDE